MMKGGMEREDERAIANEDLCLFRELQKRQNERVSSFIQSASEDYEYDTNGGSGKFALFTIPSGKKENNGLEYLLETNKSEYDWLKTPPATPLFPSLEMEPSAQLVVQKEIPISQPPSRFAGNNNLEALKPKAVDGKSNYTNSSKAEVPTRLVTPSHNRHIPTIIKNTKETQQQPANAKTEYNTKSIIIPQKQSNNNNVDFLSLNHKKSMEAKEIKPKTRGISPSVKSRVIESNMLELELQNEAPPNMRTEKGTSSTTRGRSTTRASKVVGSQIHHQDHTTTTTTPRLSCRPSRSISPSMSNGGWNQLDKTQKSLRTQKEKFTLASGNNESGVHFVGSKMVEKVVKARKFGINQVEKETKSKSLKYKV